jgi:pimeloyl-ACP methyl ester carboxylesterase
MFWTPCLIHGSRAARPRALPPRLLDRCPIRLPPHTRTSPFSTSTTGNTPTELAAHSNPLNTDTLRLPSGRTLEYHTYGPRTGFPILYIHGVPDSGVTLLGFETRLANRLNIRWIAPDRPGVGESTFYPNRSVLDYPADIRALIEHLGIRQFAILGTSGGTGYALACARAFPRKVVNGVGICAGLGPIKARFQGQSALVSQVLNAWREYPKEMTAAIDASYVAAVRDPDPRRLERLWKDSLVSNSPRQIKTPL